MLDEIFDRKRDPESRRSGGLRGALSRAISGDDERRHPDDRRQQPEDRRYRADDDDDFSRDLGSTSRRRNDAFDFD